ncbi:MAG: C4-dicarboxylate transporter DctA [Gemmataceae bacterium]|nr:C4-dicarboxylate transporter DctA [Gemmataceae bacterium]
MPQPFAKPWYRILYVQVLCAVAVGVFVGALWPDLGKSLQPLGDGFIKLVKMLIAPIIFCTVVHGIATMGDLKKIGRVGIKAIVYFEVVSTLALLIGLVVVNLLQPGQGIAYEPARGDAETALKFANQAKTHSTVAFLLNIIPDTFFGAFVSGNLLQVLLLAVLTAFALVSLQERGKPVLQGLERMSEAFFSLMAIVVQVAPIGAFGAMAFTVGAFGFSILGDLLFLMVAFYCTAAIFIFGVLGLILKLCGMSLVNYLLAIREEIFLVLGTSSSETALPGLMKKLQTMGCSRATVGLVIPTGYSFNLDGTNIYLTMAIVFLAQATRTPLGWLEQIGILFLAMLTSKGASGVTGAGFITLAATLQAVPSIPMESLALLLGIDRFMSEGRAITNLIGNGAATLVISHWEGEHPQTQRVFSIPDDSISREGGP